MELNVMCQPGWGEGVHIYISMAESLLGSPETIIMLLMATPQYTMFLVLIKEKNVKKSEMSWENILLPLPLPDISSSHYRPLDDWTWIFPDAKPVDIFLILGIYFSLYPLSRIFFSISPILLLEICQHHLCCQLLRTPSSCHRLYVPAGLSGCLGNLTPPSAVRAPEDKAPPSIPPSLLGIYHWGLHVMGVNCLHSRGTWVRGQGGICWVWGLDKGVTLTLLAASPITVSPTVQPRRCQGLGLICDAGRKCCRKGDPFQGLKLGSCLTLRKGLSEETHVLTKQELLLGRALGWRAGGEGNPGELLCRVAHSLGFYGDGINFQVVFGQSF